VKPADRSAGFFARKVVPLRDECVGTKIACPPAGTTEHIPMNMMVGGKALFGERRAERRRRALKGATLRFNKGFSAIEGVVRNESENGALLGFGDTTGVPSGFELSVNGAERSRSACVRWRSQTLVGVEFVD
jgi:hypothetical protein